MAEHNSSNTVRRLGLIWEQKELSTFFSLLEAEFTQARVVIRAATKGPVILPIAF